MSFLNEEMWQGKVFTGDWKVSSGGEQVIHEPATGAKLGRVGIADAVDVATSAIAASQAQRAWAATPFQERAAILRRAGDLWAKHADEFSFWLTREAGNITGKTQFELHVAAQESYEAAALPGSPYGQLIPDASPRLSMVQRVPAGVVGVIAPFNAPLILSIRSVAPALALGNAVLLKPDPRTAVSGGVLLARVFEEAGVPPGVLHVLPGGVDAGQALVADPHVRVISFTGSTGAGRKVSEIAGKYLKRVHLELGGNSALIVLDDVDLDRAVSAGAWGSFFHQGQICMTIGRHLVHESIYDEYVARLAAKANQLPVGNPATGQVAIGPIIDQAQRDKIHELVTASVKAGATLMAGGTYKGLFYRPTVLADHTASVPSYVNEVFGPVATVAPFSSPDDAVKLAADSEYGLSLGILTRDAMKGMELANHIPTGIAHINDQTVNDEANVPFGGVGASGTGSRFGGASANIEAFTETRWMTVRGEIAEYPF